MNNSKNRGYCGVCLVNPKDHKNVGSVLRAAGCFGASFVATTGRRYKRAITDTMKQYRHIPLFNVDDLKNIIPYDCKPVAVDIIDGSIDLHDYKHPERAFYIFGAEDATLGENVTSWCHDVVSIKTSRCLNLSAAVNIVLYDRSIKGNL